MKIFKRTRFLLCARTSLVINFDDENKKFCLDPNKKRCHHYGPMKHRLGFRGSPPFVFLIMERLGVGRVNIDD